MILLFEKYAMNNMTEIEINMCLLFLLSVSNVNKKQIENSGKKEWGCKDKDVSFNFY